VVEGSRAAGPSLTVLTDTDDDSSFLGVPIPLEDHCAGVAEVVGTIAEGCGIPASIGEDLVLAARLHDLGKADFRFQVMLHGGDELEALADEGLLAKSGMDPRDRAAFRMAFLASGLPRGYRHEATSLALIGAEAGLLEDAADADLVRHLVASHHGAARPFLPPVRDRGVNVALTKDGLTLTADTDHGLWHIGSGVAERFWSLVERYGWYGLAFLETVLRLADHRRSESEARPAGGP
jgi:CRISPR-associated endonuclease/helicase Cas3